MSLNNKLEKAIWLLLGQLPFSSLRSDLLWYKNLSHPLTSTTAYPNAHSAYLRRNTSWKFISLGAGANISCIYPFSDLPSNFCFLYSIPPLSKKGSTENANNQSRNWFIFQLNFINFTGNWVRWEIQYRRINIKIDNLLRAFQGGIFRYQLGVGMKLLEFLRILKLDPFKIRGNLTKL